MGTIYCIGRNFVKHIEELGNVVPEEPVVFTKTKHSIVQAKGQEIELPKDRGEVHYEAELVLKMGRDYNSSLEVDELISEMTVGLDLTLRDVQSKLKEKGHPWLLAKNFPNAAIVGEFIPFPGIDVCRNYDFSLQIDGKIVQKGKIRKMIFPIHSLLTYIGTNLGLKKGDLIFTGTPEGVGPLKSGQELNLHWKDQSLGRIKIS